MSVPFNRILNFFCLLQHLRQLGVVGKFVEFYGPGVSALSIADRATIANMCPEYGATVGFFPVDQNSLAYLRQTGMIYIFFYVILFFTSESNPWSEITIFFIISYRHLIL